jgi:hypothetical protein
MNPNKDSVYGPSTTVEASPCNILEALCDTLLLVMIFWVLNLDLWMAINGIYNISEAFYCVGVTRTKRCHEVI